MCGRNTEPAKLRGGAPPTEQEGMFNPQVLRAIGFSSYHQCGYEQRYVLFSNEACVREFLLLGNSSASLGKCIAIKLHEKFYVVLIHIPLLNAPLNEFLNLQSAPINSECGKELSMINSLRNGVH